MIAQPFQLLNRAWCFVAVFSATRCGVIADLCFVKYTVTDNNLESSITEDLAELAESEGIARASQTTWVYSDMENSDQYDGGRGVSSIEIYNADGTTREDGGDTCVDDVYWTDPLSPGETCAGWAGYDCNIHYDGFSSPSEVIAACPRTCGICSGTKFDGSRYITYDHLLSKLVVSQRLTGEQNSDTTSVLQAFLTAAFTDCVSKGSDEFMLVFSSHGAGYGGFGGDDNLGRRRLLNSNANIASAIEAALIAASVPDEKLDVLGFDACLMASYAAVATYADLTSYYIASEAVEPGHGWDFRALVATDGTALTAARELHAGFLAFRFPDGTTQSPMTLSIINTAGFASFKIAMDELARELRTLVAAGNDKQLVTLLARAQRSSAAFEAYVVGMEKFALDAGHFLSLFDAMCTASGEFETKLTEARIAYSDMFDRTGTGPGTNPEATGLAVFFPLRRKQAEYNYLQSDYTDASSAIGDWNDFMFTYFDSDTSLMTQEATVCGANIAPTVEQRTEDSYGNTLTEEQQAVLLLLNPASTINDDGSVTMTSEITEDTVEATLYYGMDLTTEEEMAAGEYLYIWNGLVRGDFDGNTYSSTWDGNHYLLGTEATGFEYVSFEDSGGGQITVPIVYLPPGATPTVDSDTGLITADASGGKYGWLDFGFDFDEFQLTTRITLYVMNDDGTASEVSPSAGGSLLYVLWIETDVHWFELVGGGNENPVTYNWDEDSVKALRIEMEPAWWATEYTIVDLQAWGDVGETEVYDLWTEFFYAEDIGYTCPPHSFFDGDDCRCDSGYQHAANAGCVPQTPTCSEYSFLTGGGSVVDGSNSSDYSDGLECHFKLQCAIGWVSLSFTSFQTELNYDFVRLYDGGMSISDGPVEVGTLPLLAVLSGSTVPEPITSSTSVIVIEFTTDSSITQSGWMANWSCDLVPEPEPEPELELEPKPEPEPEPEPPVPAPDGNGKYSKGAATTNTIATIGFVLVVALLQ